MEIMPPRRTHNATPVALCLQRDAVDRPCIADDRRARGDDDCERGGAGPVGDHAEEQEGRRAGRQGHQGLQGRGHRDDLRDGRRRLQPLLHQTVNCLKMINYENVFI